MRLDIFLFKKSLAISRTDAKRLISEGRVSVNGAVAMKPALDVSESDKVSVSAGENNFVSRGGFKLKGALERFNITVDGKLALDVGASSGGFTDCLLQNGAMHVIAVDSGSNQMAGVLRDDPRVTVIENFNARYMSAKDFDYAPSIVVMDVSFISATCIIPAIYEVAADGADFICLVKPQFEVGRAGVGKGGIVKDDKLRRAALQKVIDFAVDNKFDYVDSCVSSIKGGDGNVEFLVYFVVKKGV